MSRSFNPSIIEEALGALTIGANLIASPLTRRWYADWGASPNELTQSLPGDTLVPNPQLTTTRAITIHAPATTIWPWLVQMGQGRGGLYTFQRLENLARCQIANVDEIRPELQTLSPGDFIRLGPEGYPYYVVEEVLPEQALVLTTPTDDSGTKGTWAFCLQPLSATSTRLINRSRLSYSPTFANRLMWRAITDPVFFVMERRMLLGIRDRAEAMRITPLSQAAA